MVKTQSQTENITIKKEEEEDCKPSLRLESVRDTRASARIAKRKSPIINNRPVSAQQVKLEEDTDTKSLFQSSTKYSKSGKRRYLSQEQINQLIDYIVNHNMNVTEASRKVNISRPTGFRYYNLYNNDPEKRIPLPRDQTPKLYTQEQIKNLIRYINSDKMSIGEASAKADMYYDSGRHYYSRYLKDPNNNIPIPRPFKNCTQDQKNEFIDYVVRDKMSILAASKKAKMSITTAQRYYQKYFEVQNPDIARPSHIATHKCYTQEQMKEVISYVVDDEMSIAAAARKANMNPSSAKRYYRLYLKDNKIKVPVRKIIKAYSQD